MPDDDQFWRLMPADQVELVVFDLEPRRAPRALIAAVKAETQ